MILIALAATAALSAADLPAPKVWEPGVISTSLHDGAPTFSPDGQTVYFSRSVGDGKPAAAVHVSHRKGGRWTAPEVAPFSGRFSDMEPAMAPDGSHLVFISNRPAQPGGKLLDGFYDKQAWPGGGGALWRGADRSRCRSRGARPPPRPVACRR